MKNIKKIGIPVLMIITVLFMTVMIPSLIEGDFRKETFEYQKTRVVANTLKINDSVNIRSEPIVLFEKSSGKTNSFGCVEKGDISITAYFKTTERLDRNGAFLGFYAQELAKSGLVPELNGDPDWIVWINEKYVVVT